MYHRPLFSATAKRTETASILRTNSRNHRSKAKIALLASCRLGSMVKRLPINSTNFMESSAGYKGVRLFSPLAKPCRRSPLHPLRGGRQPHSTAFAEFKLSISDERYKNFL